MLAVGATVAGGVAETKEIEFTQPQPVGTKFQVNREAKTQKAPVHLAQYHGWRVSKNVEDDRSGQFAEIFNKQQVDDPTLLQGLTENPDLAGGDQAGLEPDLEKTINAAVERDKQEILAKLAKGIKPGSTLEEERQIESADKILFNKKRIHEP